MTDIQLEITDKKGRAFAQAPNGEEAEMTFSIAGKYLWIIDHTEVPDAFRGQGVGRKLLQQIIDYVREHKVKVLPLCPYAKSVFDKEEGIRDVLQ